MGFISKCNKSMNLYHGFGSEILVIVRKDP